MSVLTAPPPVVAAPACTPSQGEQHFVVHDVDWASYLAIGEIFRDRPAIRLTYDRGTLEFMTTSPDHERHKLWLGRVIDMLAEELNLPLEGAGQMTFQRSDVERGFEPDQCYWIANAGRMQDRRDWLPDRDPPPDLIIEIEVSRSARNRMGIFAAIGCPEVWRFDGETLRIEVLQADGTYVGTGRSLSFPTIAVREVVPFLHLDQPADFAIHMRAIRAWVRQQLTAAPPSGPADAVHG
jgi:Uma2 family endonuclease